METTATGSASLRLLVLGFNDNERRLLQAIVKLSQRRQPALHLVDTADGQSADVILVDCLDASAKAWAAQQPWMNNKPVGWVDAPGEVPPGHTKMKRPVQWPILPMLLSRILFNAGDAAEQAPPPPPPQSPAAPAQPAAAAPTPPRPSFQQPAAAPTAARPAPAPGVPPRPAAPAQPAAPPRPAAPAADLQVAGVKVLVVDDSLAVRQQLKTFLEQKGFAVSYAESGDAALEICKTSAFDLILLDVLMPGIDGYETCRRVKGMPHLAKSAKVVMLTSRTSPFDRIRSKMVGCDAYLTKPVQAQKLYDTLRQYAVR